MPERQRHEHLRSDLHQQNAGDLRAREAEHAQAGELPRPLLKRDASDVVDHADRDDDCERGQDRREDQNELGGRVLEAREGPPPSR